MIKKVHLALLGMVLCAPTFGQVRKNALVESFRAQHGATTSVSEATQSLNFVRFPANAPYRTSGRGAVEKAFNFLNQNQSLWGIRSGDDSFLLKNTQRDMYKLEHVTLQQIYKGVPVYDGVMKFRFDKATNITSVNGNYLENIKLNPVPTITQEEAEARAIKRVSVTDEMQIIPNLKAHQSQLYIFQKGLVEGTPGAHYLVYEVEVRNGGDVREFVFIDAHSGEWVEQFTGIHGIDRKLYNRTILPGNLIWQEGAGPLPTDVWQHSELETARHIYNLFDRTFGYTSYDGQDATMITTHNNPAINCPNANWNGVSANYCTSVAADDVVAHEWAHAYIEYTSGLIYAWQPGALNESISDIWGEIIDQLNNPYFDAGETDALRTGVCASSTRWLLGEGATAFNQPLRDMWNPNCYNQPARMLDPLYYCGTADNGGVHYNSGVSNHLFALLVDGGTFNGHTIPAIGLTKAAHLIWRVQSNYLTKTSNFKVFAQALVAAGQDLMTVGELAALVIEDGGPASGSGVYFTAADLASINSAIAATEMLETPSCGVAPMFAEVADDCGGSGPANLLFSADFESGTDGFTMSATNAYVSTQWKRESNSQGNTTSFMRVNTMDTRTCSGIHTGLASLESPAILISPEAVGPLKMSFRHLVSLEPHYDGGNLRYKVGDGSWTLVSNTHMTHNPYNTTIRATDQTDNPLFNQPVFSGPLIGELVSNWGETRINLTSLGILPGQTVSFRWDVGWDCMVGYDGWYIDDVKIYSCTAATPAVHFVASGVSVNEAEANTAGDCVDFVEKEIAVTIDKAPSAPVRVTLKPSTDPALTTAKRGVNADYSFEPAFVTLEAGQLTQHFTIRIYNDAYLEGDEQVTFGYTLDAGSGDAFAASSAQTFTLRIKDDDIEPGTLTSTVLYENFNSFPIGWGTDNGSVAHAAYWGVSSSYGGVNGSPYALVNSDVLGEMDEILESPEFNTAGMMDIQLTFEQYFEVFSGGFNEQAIVEVWDGHTWQEVDRQSSAQGTKGYWKSGNLRTVAISDAYANAAMKLRFRFHANYDWWWIVDEVKVTARKPHLVQTAVNSGAPASTYLGPYETAVFYDPYSGNVLAKIQNLSDHDYGCTTVEVDRSGTSERDWLYGYHASDKTLKVSPTNPNGAGEYKITLYYTGDEVAGMPTIQSVGKSEGSIAAPSGGAWAEFEAAAIFNSDMAYLAKFNTGFSGFALSDAPPVGSLPVQLISFDAIRERGAVLLSWSTAWEMNALSFEVQQSVDGYKWKSVGAVKAVGTTEQPQHYQFVDASLPSGTGYYRLKIQDVDEAFDYSTIRSVFMGESTVRVFPNPASERLLVHTPADDSLAILEIYNAMGKLVLRETDQVVSDGVDTRAYPAGLYTIKLITLSGQRSTHKVMIHK
jgi:Zn-dependent metalloprotease